MALILFLCEKFYCHNSPGGTQCSELLPAQQLVLNTSV